jgi:multidrug efflux system outer membrane protein
MLAAMPCRLAAVLALAVLPFAACAAPRPLAGAEAELQALAAKVRGTVGIREESLELVRRRAAGGLSSDLDVAQASGALADARLQLSELIRQRALLENQLGVLSGAPGLRVPPGDLAAMPVPPLPPAGLPSSLVDRRPDLRQTEQALAAATALIGVAKAQEYPSFSLTGLLGTQKVSSASHL